MTSLLNYWQLPLSYWQLLLNNWQFLLSYSQFLLSYSQLLLASQLLAVAILLLAVDTYLQLQLLGGRGLRVMCKNTIIGLEKKQQYFGGNPRHSVKLNYLCTMLEKNFLGGFAPSVIGSPAI